MKFLLYLVATALAFLHEASASVGIRIVYHGARTEDSQCSDSENQLINTALHDEIFDRRNLRGCEPNNKIYVPGVPHPMHCCSACANIAPGFCFFAFASCCQLDCSKQDRQLDATIDPLQLAATRELSEEALRECEREKEGAIATLRNGAGVSESCNRFLQEPMTVTCYMY